MIWTLIHLVCVYQHCTTKEVNTSSSWIFKCTGEQRQSSQGYPESTPSFCPTWKSFKQRDAHLEEISPVNYWNWFSCFWTLWKQKSDKKLPLISRFFRKILFYIYFLLSEMFPPGGRALKSQEPNRIYRLQEVTKCTNLWKLLKLTGSTIIPSWVWGCKSGKKL